MVEQIIAVILYAIKTSEMDCAGAGAVILVSHMVWLP